MKKFLLKISSYKKNFLSNFIKDIFFDKFKQKSGIKVINLPKTIIKHTILKSHFVNKKAKNHYAIIYYNRLVKTKIWAFNRIKKKLSKKSFKNIAIKLMIKGVSFNLVKQ